MTQSRLQTCLADLATKQQKAFIAFITAGDPDLETSAALLAGLPEAGADIIELGMPFTDPMADGPAIQRASLRALQAGQTLKRTLDMVKQFRNQNQKTPVVLMGYYNPIYRYGVPRFIADAQTAGVDGLIIVDLPPEEDDELCLPAHQAGLHFIRLVTPTTDAARLPRVLTHSSGFVYYVSIAGTTGTTPPKHSQVANAIARIAPHTELPIMVGFGIRTPKDARAIAALAQGVVVGSALVDAIARQPNKNCVRDVLALAAKLAGATHQ